MTATLRVPVACGVDIGTTNLKVVVMDRDGAVVARVSRPTPRVTGGFSVDGHALIDAIEQMILAACSDRFEVNAVCSAGVGEDGVLVDTDFRPLTPALAWFDPRRLELFDALRPSLHNDEAFDSASDPVRTIVGWDWARRQVPEGTAANWIALTDLASVHWTRRPFLSDTLASRTAAWSSTERLWEQDRVTLTLGSTDLLPPVMRTGDTVGFVNAPDRRLAAVLASDAIAVVGGHDHPIAGWGVSRMSSIAVLDSMGTAEVVVAQSPRSRVIRQDYFDVAPGIRSEGTTILRVEELSRNVQWASRDREVARRIRELLDGAVQPLPVLESGYFIPGARGGGAPGYSRDAPYDPEVRAAAVLGALAIAGREAVRAVVSELTGPFEVRIAGGWTRSPGWIDIKAEINGVRSVAILEPEVTAVGAALLAAEARGWAPDPARALGGFTSTIMG